MGVILSGDMKLAMKMCKNLKENGLCRTKENTSLQHCKSQPQNCCAMCDAEINKSCDAKNGICTYLFG